MQKISFFLSALFILLLSSGCNDSTTGHIYIISTNDVHATIDAMPKLATLVKEYETKGEVILVDSGDRVTGNAYVDDAQQPGLPIIELMNEVGYDVVTLGNHEFDKGREVLYSMVDASSFEWVCCNMEDKQHNTTIKPYTTITTGGIDICFVGVVDTDQDGHPLGSAEAYADFCFTRDIEAAEGVCNELPTSDMTILLSHMGLDGDRRLATLTDGYQWIAGGHSHDIVASNVNGTYISQNNKNIRYVTVADIEVKDGEITKVSYTQHNTSEITPDSHISEIVEVLKASDPGLNSVEATLTSPATKSGVTNFTIESLASYPYPDGFCPEISIYHAGGVRLDGFIGDGIRRVDILNNDPFISTIYIGELTTEQIEEFILTKYNNGTPENPDKESHYPYFLSDVPYTIVVEDGKESPNALMLGHKLEQRSYRVAMCNYIAENYIAKDIVATQLHDTGITVREAMFHHVSTFRQTGYTPDNTIRQHEISISELNER